MFEFAVAIGEGQDYSFEFLLEGGHLAIQGVQFAFSFCALPDLEAVDLLGEHEHAVLGQGLG